MSAKFIKIADRINHTPAGNIAVGAVVVVGGLVCVATAAIAAGELGTLNIVGEYELDLAEGKTFTDGASVYVSASEATDAGTFFGYAVGASASGKVKAVLIQSPPDAS